MDLKMVHQRGQGRVQLGTLSKKPHGSKFLLEEKSIVTQQPGTKEAKMVPFSLYKIWTLQLGKAQAGKVLCTYKDF